MSARSLSPVLLAVIVVGAPLVASAQPVPRVSRWYRGPGYGGTAGYPYGGGYSFSSTPIEGAQRGLADVIRASGEAKVATADSLLTYEEARSKYFDNKLKWVDVFWERRRINEAERAKDYDKQRARRDAWRNNRTRTVSRLNPEQLDPSTGKIYWPVALQAPEFYNHKKKIDELFLIRRESPVPGLDQEINRTTQAMKEELKEHIHDMTPHEYLGARKFIDGLNSEIHNPHG